MQSGWQIIWRYIFFIYTIDSVLKKKKQFSWLQTNIEMLVSKEMKLGGNYCCWKRGVAKPIISARHPLTIKAAENPQFLPNFLQTADGANSRSPSFFPNHPVLPIWAFSKNNCHPAEKSFMLQNPIAFDLTTYSELVTRVP